MPQVRMFLRRPSWRVCAAIAWLALAAPPAHADDPKPKFGPHAVPIQQSHDYLRRHGAPDYWALSPYYAAQQTNSACSLAAITMMVNALHGLPPHGIDRLVTQEAVLGRLPAFDRWGDALAPLAQAGSGR